MGIAYTVRGISKTFIPVDAYVTAHNVYKYLNTIFVVKCSFIYVDISQIMSSYLSLVNFQIRKENIAFKRGSRAHRCYEMYKHIHFLKKRSVVLRISELFCWSFITAGEDKIRSLSTFRKLCTFLTSNPCIFSKIYLVVFMVFQMPELVIFQYQTGIC